MSAKTTFWYGLVVALAVIASAVALPLSTNDEPASESSSKTVVLPELPKESTGQTEDVATVVSTDPSTVPQTVKTESNDGGAISTVAAATTSNADATATSNADAAATASDATLGVHQTETATGSTLPAESETGSDRSDTTTATAATAAATGSGLQKPTAGVQSQRPKPYYAADAQTVKVGPTVPFYLEFFQPFQPFPTSSDPNRRQQPYGAVIDPFDPFENNPMASPFNRIIEAYTNEFRTPEVIIVKPKRNVQLNATSMPPIPLLMNIMLNAFRHEPTEMLESFDQNMQRIPQQVENFDNTQSGSNKPVSKTTTKTEVINGHVVQINETTYTNGDENHKSFYHFKEIQVLPDANSKKFANEKLTSITQDDSEKVEQNEIKRDPIEPFNVPEAIIQPNIEKKSVVASGPLDEYYQTAAASHYGSPYAPAYYVPKSSYNPMPSPPPITWNSLFDHQRQHGHHFGGHQHGGHQLGGNPYGGHQHGGNPYGGHQPATPVPGPHFGGSGVGGASPVISLSGDTLVNDLMAERIKASGSQYQLPADVVLVDVNELQQRRPGATRGVRRSPQQNSAHDSGPRVILL